MNTSFLQGTFKTIQFWE